MNFCNHCGAKLEQDVPHACSEIAASAGASHPASSESFNLRKEPWGSAASNGTDGQTAQQTYTEHSQPQHSMGQFAREATSAFETRTLLTLLKQPTEAARLHPQRDWLYAVIGILLSSLGFAVWAYIVSKHFFGFLFGPSDILSLLDRGAPSIPFSFFIRFLVIAILSIGALIGALWLTLSFKGKERPGLLPAFVRLGALQMPFSVGFLLAGLVSVISFTQLSFFMVGCLLLSSVVLTTTEMAELGKVERSNRFAFITIAMGMHMIISLILFKIFF
ncbi:hypothetical protein MH117_24350 [Paenibacillus sp. ACRRX]|uniref:hypothetical protein n=1 Tax=Paenibacillus sp. ACRRX TaxID=2918206 RepID=UPI001EF628BE|nr:hypothetical protein [Paenibacillus sp. ACRRX]MCG7410532.1 hypothetical protein [Paenibacillus sp. ACRRX]